MNENWINIDFVYIIDNLEEFPVTKCMIYPK